ncbi:MAG: ABC transporter ATP-binding protein/permease [Clostridiales bacterium]|nr:ABC transporter ATP-binding protein/permease [Clostridiales bacterium]
MSMWKYVKKYILLALLAATFMVGEVSMDLIQPTLMSRIVDEGVLGAGNGSAGNIEVILRLGLQMIALVIFGGLCGSMNNLCTQTASQSIGNDIRKDCFRRIMAFSFPQMDRFGTGSLVTRVTNDITQVQTFLSLFVRGMIRTGMLTFGSMAFMLRLNPAFGRIVIAAFPLIVAVLAFCLLRSGPMFERLQVQLDGINAIMQEDISGIRVIKACVRELYEKARFGKANDALTGTQLSMLTLFAFMNPTVNMLMNVVVALILLTGSQLVQAGVTTPGVIMASITYTTQLLSGILMLVMLFQNISRGVASWKRVREVLGSEPELRDGAHTESLRGRIELRDVSFAYPGSEKRVLEHISLTIEPGETVAVMGATGCGKSTLVRLIPRLYDVTEGAVLVDGVDVREYDQRALRGQIAIALQKSELFTESIGENIAWGRPGAQREEIEQAAAAAQAEEFILRTPDGYDTPVAERGMSLSGGQKQRLSIARALVRRAPVLILDDATSALDLATEARLYDALARLAPDSTKIVVAQRIATVRRADRIVLLENGRIAACGSHEQLLAGCAAYREIVDSQMGEEEQHDGPQAC